MVASAVGNSAQDSRGEKQRGQNGCDGPRLNSFSITWGHLKAYSFLLNPSPSLVDLRVAHSGLIQQWRPSPRNVNLC